MGTQVSADYRPSENEPFMNERQREYFRRKLNLWKDEILKESRETIQNLQADARSARSACGTVSACRFWMVSRLSLRISSFQRLSLRRKYSR